MSMYHLASKGRRAPRTVGIGLLAALWAVATPVLAHHSFAMFEQDKTLTLSGTVKEFQFNNPHCFIQLLVPGGTGTAEWSIEMAAPAHLVRSGWNKNTVKPGDKLTVVIHPIKDGSNGGSYVSATGADAKPL